MAYEAPMSGQVWRHYKTEKNYFVNHIGVDTETGYPSVAYFPLDQYETYREKGPDHVDWGHRPLHIFLESVKTEAGTFVQRFTRNEAAEKTS